jgi:hypothetical protein
MLFALAGREDSVLHLRTTISALATVIWLGSAASAQDQSAAERHGILHPGFKAGLAWTHVRDFGYERHGWNDGAGIGFGGTLVVDATSFLAVQSELSYLNKRGSVDLWDGTVRTGELVFSRQCLQAALLFRLGPVISDFDPGRRVYPFIIVGPAVSMSGNDQFPLGADSDARDTDLAGVIGAGADWNAGWGPYLSLDLRFEWGFQYQDIGGKDTNVSLLVGLLWP